MSSNNWILVATEQAKELFVAEAIDRLTGGNWSYMPMEYRTKAISTHHKRRKIIAVPIIPRLVFMSASHRNLDEIMAIRGVERIVRNEWGAPEVIPSYEMNRFQAKVDEHRLWAEKLAAKNQRPRKPPRFDNFAALKAWFDKSGGEGEVIDSETGEILDKAAA